MRTHETKFIRQGDGEDLVDAKVGGVHLMDSRLQPSQLSLPLLCGMGLRLLIMW